MFAPNRLLEALEKMIDQRIAQALKQPDPFPETDWSAVIYFELQELQSK